MRGISRVLALLLLVSGLASAQGVPGALAPCKMDGSDCAPATGTVTTTGTLASGRVALGSGATSITGDSGCTWTGTGTGFVLGLGTDVFLSRSSAATLRVTGAIVSSASVTAEANVWAQGKYLVGSSADLYLSRASAGTLLVEDGSGNARDVQARTGTFGTSVVTPLVSGGADSATPNATVVTGTGSRGGTDTNVAGGNLTIRPGAGTGSATGSSIVFQTPTAGASGTTAQTQTTRLEISESGVRTSVASNTPDQARIAGTIFGTDGNGGTITAASSGWSFFNSGGTRSIYIDPNSVTVGGGTVTSGATGIAFRVNGVAEILAPLRLAGYTVATLPAGTVGDTAYVTDATAPTYLGTLTGGGAVTCPVMYNGAAWVSH